MADREKVVSGLEHCIKEGYAEEICPDCPYLDKHPSECIGQLMSDAIVLLREQEAVSTIVEQPLNDTRYIFCGACKAMLAQNKSKGYKYCPWCGRKVKWDG